MKVQIIQTLSILVQNLSNEVSIFYLLSNNYINDMIVHRFDFNDEEIVAYYINFLKVTCTFACIHSTSPFVHALRL